MKHTFVAMLCLLLLVATGCSEYVSVTKTQDYDYKYEMAKQYYAQGQYNRASLLLNDVLTILKGTDQGEESLFLAGTCAMKARNYQSASTIFTYAAVTEFQNFIETYPASKYRQQAQDFIFKLQDKLVEKEYLSAKLYYDLGPYIGNGSNGNYQACIVTAENAIKDYPYTSKREDFAILILRAKFALAQHSIESKKEERYHTAIDEYYGFVSEYPESKHMKEAQALFNKAKKYVVSEEEEPSDVSSAN